MNENISPEQYEAEISALQQRLDFTKDMLMESAHKDSHNPFNNPTEYRHYNSNYSEILPSIKEPFAEIPLNPKYSERCKLKKLYNITGIQLIFLILSSNILMYLISAGIMLLLHYINPEIPRSQISSYFASTSNISVNMIVFMICNVSASLIGLKWSKISPSSLFKTRDFSVFKLIIYFLIAFTIQYFSIAIISVVEKLINNVGFNMYNPNDFSNFDTPLANVSDFIYGVIVAPITEELFYRGFVLKNLSKANQRFGIFMTAFLFGIMHGNIPQAILGFCMGIFLAHITIKHNSIIPAIAVHMFNNSLYYITALLSNVKSFEGIFIINIVHSIIMIIGTFALLVFAIQNKLPSSTPHQVRRGYPLALGSVPIIIAISLYVYEIISKIILIS